jgi:CelD/BcsL family acetyltransferase involved in cellulose biosynthesis
MRRGQVSFTAWEDVAAAPAPAQVPRAVPGEGLALAIRKIDDAPAFDALELDWNALLERSDASVFQSFEWQRTWWRHFGERRRNARLHIVTVRAEGRLVAIAPFYVERERVLGLFRLRRLLLIGHRDSDYLDAIVAAGWEEECAGAIAAHLAEHADVFDVVVLEETPDGSLMGRLLYEALLRRGFAASRHVEELCPQTALGKSWEETIARFSLGDRREVRRRLRNMRKEHEVELEVVPPGGAVEPAMRQFVEMHQERWSRDGYWGVFADPGMAAFHRDVAERLSRRGWLFLTFLLVDGRRCAVNYGFSFRGSVSVYLTGSDAVSTGLARHSPGRTLHALGMQWAIDHGRTLYDFMRGPEPYKYELGAVDVPNWTVVAYPRHSRLTEGTHATYLFLRSASRRARREAHALRVARRNGGWLSPALRTHVARAVRRALGDLRRILRRRPRARRGAGAAAPSDGAGGRR